MVFFFFHLFALSISLGLYVGWFAHWYRTVISSVAFLGLLFLCWLAAEPSLER